MLHAHQVDTVRRLVRQTFQAHGVETDDAVLEKILVRDGFYCGRCFSCDGMRAVWFIEENSVKFYRRDGSFLDACSAEEPPVEPARRVA